MDVLHGTPSVVFQCVRRVPLRKLPRRLKDLPAARLESLFGQAADRLSGEERALLECARAILYSEIHDTARGFAHLEVVSSTYDMKGARISFAHRFVTEWLSTGGKF